MNGLSSSPFAVGVDGGGSKTLAVVVDAQGNERGRGMAGSSNHTGVGIERAVQHIYRANDAELVIGDEGSGYGLGCRCLQAVARATDGRGQATLLVEMLLRYWKLDSASDMIGKVYNDCDKAAIAALSGLVFAAARDGDEVACDMVEDAAYVL